MRILIVGRGGREHALAWKLAQSSEVEELYCAPGNAGIAEVAECIAVGEMEFDRLAEFATRKAIDLTVVGPEAPLLKGIVDCFQAKGLTIFGPGQKAALIEGSKSFAKQLLLEEGVPTAAHQTFLDYERALSYLRSCEPPVVVKADGLAAGKGVVVAETIKDAEAALRVIMCCRKFGEAGARVVIEEYMEGEELSVMALVSGETVVPLVPAQDHKRVYDGDKGPNTGGMGAYSPVPRYGPELMDEVKARILQPVASGLVRRGTPFYGVLYAGLMITDSGPKVVEFNARFGDPETQVVLPRLKTDLAGLLWDTATGNLKPMEPAISDDAAICVVLVSAGYPEAYEKGEVIRGLSGLRQNTLVFHAGTRRDEQGNLRTDGGRVIGVTCTAPDLSRARKLVYSEVKKVQFAGCHYRQDIGVKALT